MSWEVGEGEGGGGRGERNFMSGGEEEGGERSGGVAEEEIDEWEVYLGAYKEEVFALHLVISVDDLC